MVEQHSNFWADAWIAEGMARGAEQGAEAGRKELLMKLVRTRYGAGTAAAIAPLLEAVHSLPTLDEIGLWIVEGGSADALLSRVRAL